MIHANELRIGNLFLDEKGDIKTVLALHKEGIVITDFTKPKEIKGHTAYGVSGIVRVQTHVWYEGANGIQLTQEILEKCGFEFGETIAKCNKDDVNNQAWSIQISNLDWLEFQIVKGVDATTNQPVTWPEWRIANECSYIRQDFYGQPKYLHQLQNLFYSLCGVELNVQL